MGLDVFIFSKGPPAEKSGIPPPKGQRWNDKRLAVKLLVPYGAMLQIKSPGCPRLKMAQEKPVTATGQLDNISTVNTSKITAPGTLEEVGELR